MPELVRRMEVFTGAGRRRSWSPAEKAAIVAESYGADETVCAVARRHGLTPQQLFTWRRLARRSVLASVPMFVRRSWRRQNRNRRRQRSRDAARVVVDPGLRG
jgi:transposase